MAGRASKWMGRGREDTKNSFLIELLENDWARLK
jgi:hypothetical protein